MMWMRRMHGGAIASGVAWALRSCQTTPIRVAMGQRYGYPHTCVVEAVLKRYLLRSHVPRHSCTACGGRGAVQPVLSRLLPPMSSFSSLRSRFSDKRRQFTQRIAANLGLAEAKEVSWRGLAAAWFPGLIAAFGQDPAFDRSAAEFERNEQAAEALTKAFERYVRALQELGAAQSDLAQQIVRLRSPASTPSAVGARTPETALVSDAAAAASLAPAQGQAGAAQPVGPTGRVRSLPRVHAGERTDSVAAAGSAPFAAAAEQPPSEDGGTGSLRPVPATPLEQPSITHMYQRLDQAARAHRLRIDAAVTGVWRRHVRRPLGRWMLWHDAVRARIAEKRKLLVRPQAASVRGAKPGAC